jgi:outer membrane protein OmpA-like peptidoglycan-associated protein
LWYVEILPDETYGTPVNLGPTINTEARESFPFVSEKNNLYFASDGHAGLGGFDVYVTPLDAMGMPGEANNLGQPANSNQDDFGFIIKEDEYVGYMSSNRDGNRGSIDDEIYRVQEICEVTVNGLVFDAETKNPLPVADVTLLNDVNAVVGTFKADANGNFNFTAICEKQYSIRAVKEGYLPNEVVINTPAISGTIQVDIPLTRKDICDPNDLGCKLNLQPIYFDFDRYNIRPDAEVELAKIQAAMVEYPELVIHIESHTDSRGNDAYNEALSEKRAQSTLNWLVSKGIDRNRLSAKGYGEYRLVNECSNGVKCTEEEHQLNRRSMFIIQD